MVLTTISSDEGDSLTVAHRAVCPTVRLPSDLRSRKNRRVGPWGTLLVGHVGSPPRTGLDLIVKAVDDSNTRHKYHIERRICSVVMC